MGDRREGRRKVSGGGKGQEDISHLALNNPGVTLAAIVLPCSKEFLKLGGRWQTVMSEKQTNENSSNNVPYNRTGSRKSQEHG